MMARFVERDDGAENRRTIIGYLQRHGRPLAVYTDHAGHFGQWLTKKEERTDTIISRALGELGVEVILAGSPQAKGRVERTFGTAQDRLIKEMRVAGISTLDAANRFLAEYWVPFWNERFAVEPQDTLDAHRPLPPGIDLEAPLRRDGDPQGGPRLHDPLQEPVLADPGAGRPEVFGRVTRSSLNADFVGTSTSGSANATWPSSPWVGPVLRQHRRRLSPRSRESRGRSRRSPHWTIHGESKTTRVPGWPWPGGTSGSRKRLREAMESPRSRRMPYLPSVPDGREPRRTVEAGPDMVPASWPHRPGKAGCDPAQRDHRQPPDLRAGQARPSDRGVHYPPHPLPAPTGRGWQTLTQGGTFLFRSTPGHFYSGLTRLRQRGSYRTRRRSLPYPGLHKDPESTCVRGTHLWAPAVRDCAVLGRDALASGGCALGT